MPGWIIRPPNQIIQGDIEEIGEGDELFISRVTPIFVSLIHNRRHANGGIHRFLRQTTVSP